MAGKHSSVFIPKELYIPFTLYVVRKGITKSEFLLSAIREKLQREEVLDSEGKEIKK